MLNGIRIFTADAVWRNILTDLGAIAAPAASGADICFDALGFAAPISAIELKSKIINEIDSRNKKTVRAMTGRDAALPELQMRIVVALAAAAADMAALKNILGFAPDVATHTIDTAIYNLRKTFGRDFIKFENGKYKICPIN